MKQRKYLCGLLALLMLTGCANNTGAPTSVTAEGNGQAAVSDADAAESAVQPAGETNAGTPANGDAEQIAAARAVLETYLESMRDHDADKLLSSSNYREMMMIMGDGTVDEEELRQSAAGTACAKDGNLQWKVSEGRLEPGIAEQYNSTLQCFLEDAKAAAEEGGEDAQSRYKTFKETIVPIETVCSFDVTLFDEDEEETNTFHLSRTNGIWTLNHLVTDSMVSGDNRSRLPAASEEAKSLYNAVNMAFADMECMDIDLSELNGDIYLTGDDLKDASEQTGELTAPDVIRKQLCWVITNYYSDAYKLESLALLIRKERCIAVAVGKHEDAGTVYSIYPLFADGGDDIEKAPESIEEALAIAEKCA